MHLSPLDAERELAYKLKDSGARVLVTTNIGFMGLLAQKLKADGLVDHLIVGDDTAFGPSAIPTTPIAADAGLIRFEKLRAEGADKLPRPVADAWTSTTSRCCSTPAARPASPRARC